MLSQPVYFAAPLPADRLLPSPFSSDNCRVPRSFSARCGIPQISTLEFPGHTRTSDPAAVASHISRKTSEIWGPHRLVVRKDPRVPLLGRIVVSVAQRTEK